MSTIADRKQSLRMVNYDYFLVFLLFFASLLILFHVLLSVIVRQSVSVDLSVGCV